MTTTSVLAQRIIALESQVVDLENEIQEWETSTGLVSKQGDPDGIKPAANKEQLDLLWGCIPCLRHFLAQMTRFKVGRRYLVFGLVETDLVDLADAAQAQLPEEED